MDPLRAAIRRSRQKNAVPSPYTGIPVDMQAFVEQTLAVLSANLGVELKKEIIIFFEKWVVSHRDELRGEPGVPGAAPDPEYVARQAAQLVEVPTPAEVARLVEPKEVDVQAVATALASMLPDLQALEERLRSELVAEKSEEKPKLTIADVIGLEPYLKNLARATREKNARMIHGGGSSVLFGGAAPGTVNMVYDEDVAKGASGTSFILAHTPIAGSVALHRGGARQTAKTTTTTADFSISGATITLTTALSAGETLTADYAYQS